MRKLKEMLVSWDILRNANFSPIFFLQGDYGIGNIKIVLKNLKDFQGNIRAVFCSSNNPTEPYVVEKEIDSTITTNINIAIPNEVLQGFGKVFCRLVLRSSDRGKIVGSIQEVYFHVVEKKDWEFLEPLLPSDEKEYVKDIVDELYEILKNSKNELKEYAGQLKDDMQKDIITLEEAQAIIDKYKNQNKEERLLEQLQKELLMI